MPRKKVVTTTTTERKIRPALTPEADEQLMISLATDLVKQRLIDGTASSQETTHFLKLGSSKYRLEQEKMSKENDLIDAKIENLKHQSNSEEMFAKAIDAMRRYAGLGESNNDEEEY